MSRVIEGFYVRFFWDWLAFISGAFRWKVFAVFADDVGETSSLSPHAALLTPCPIAINAALDTVVNIRRGLMDERERNQQYIKRRDQENEEIALTVGKLRVELEAAENNLIDSECHVAELEEALRDKQALLEASEKRNAKLQSENAYIRNRYKELDLLIGKNILVMQAAIIEWQATGDAKSGLAWIYNTLFGPGELPDESEKDAQAYFNRKYAPIDEKLMALHKWFWEQSEAERAAGICIKGE